MVTSGQPSLNPRLVKEADALADLGYDVTVLYAYWNDWGTKFDKELIPQKKWRAVRIGGDPDNENLIFFFSRLIQFISKMISRYSKVRFLTSIAIARPAYFLARSASKYDADLYIGHNLGALPAVVKAARARRKLCGFDAEDFHRFEADDDPASEDVVRKSAIEDRYIPFLDYLTVSSPSIGEGYKRLFPLVDPVTILNTFPSEPTLSRPMINKNGPVRLLWFSQTIGPKRGLEDIIRALHLLKDFRFELHLLGYLSVTAKKEYLDKLTTGGQLDIHFHAPVNPLQLAVFASQFDIGLALEPGFSTNNNSALSNKLFTYLQSGLCIVASDTVAQSHFLEHYPGAGTIYPRGNFQALSEILLALHYDREGLWNQRIAAFELGRTELSWEKEREKFTDLIGQTLVRE